MEVIIKAKDMTGEKYGRLTVMKRVGTKNRNAMWLCKCDCGNETIVSRSGLIRGQTTSCGCYQKEVISQIKKKYNTYDLSKEYGIGWTDEGNAFYFDIEDYDLIRNYYWSNHQNKYIRTKIDNLNRPMMHQIISNKYFDGHMLDHINGNGFDNRKCNLRKATLNENSKNHKIYKTNKSGCSGVRLIDKNKWQSYIYYNRQRIDLGTYDSYDEAVKIRKSAEKEYFKEFRRKDNNEQLELHTGNDNSITNRTYTSREKIYS